MTIQTKFGEACYNDLSIVDLEDALNSPADRTSMRDWNITEDEYFDGIREALAEKKAERDGEAA